MLTARIEAFPEELVSAKIIEVADEAREMGNSRARLANNPFWATNIVPCLCYKEPLTAVGTIVQLDETALTIFYSIAVWDFKKVLKMLLGQCYPRKWCTDTSILQNTV